ncbi:MAG TPA: hypothetical protein VFT66_07235 [Roseiflexaceae bacterium]|nr:hypothetical protein [Roseiflexaceae bacterium]
MMMTFVLGMMLSGCGAAPATGALEGNTEATPTNSVPMPPTAPQPTAAPEPTGSSSSAMTVNPGQPFDLALGQSAHLASDQFSVTFAQVIEDSRCPKGVECVWAGQVVVMFDVSENGQTSSPIQLTLGGGRPGAKAAEQVAGHTVQLMAVEPYPQNGKKPAPADYTVTLEVR